MRQLPSEDEAIAPRGPDTLAKDTLAHRTVEAIEAA